MKISISGKGGSGKSTVTTLLAMAFRDRGYRPVVVDSDESNAILYRLLGMPAPPQPLVALAGGRKMVRELMPPGYKPGSAGNGTNVLTQAQIALAELPSENIAENDDLRLVIIGKILESLEGCACPMGVLGREFLSKLKLGEKEIAIADMEAGIEHFGRGIESGLDTVLIVVEPSFESISLAERIKHLANGIGIDRVWAILNKINSDALNIKLSDELTQREVKVIGNIPYDEEIFSACLEGRSLSGIKGRVGDSLHNTVDFLLSKNDTGLRG
jgi:CO dehydrogenase maturation factor